MGPVSDTYMLEDYLESTDTCLDYTGVLLSGIKPNPLGGTKQWSSAR